MASQRTPNAEAIEDDEMQYGRVGATTKEELAAAHPNRPINHSKTMPFHELFKSIFNPLSDNKKKTTGPAVSRQRKGPGGTKLSSNEMRINIIERFISRWRSDVGNDFYPALRLIVPAQDRDRPMYGLKEKAIGKLLVKLVKLNPSSEDGFNLLNWKLPGQTTASRMAGDFAGRCYEVLSKRSMRNNVGDMRIAEVNALLDKLAAAQKEEHQLPIFEEFYERMNAEELMWLIRIILRQMKVGATEKTFLNLWHPDGEALFNVTSSLRKVCWDLKDPAIRLEDDAAGVALMSCFQPQLAQFQMHTFQKMVEKLGTNEDDPEFWIEEKLDGERMQMHMLEDDRYPGGKQFSFWSRNAKDYTHLYGESFEDDTSALTRHIKDAFDPSVRNIILDGEMITWDPESDMMVPFGTLKTAAIEQQRNPFGTGIRPLFRVFDILYFNDTDITKYTLRDRRNALNRCIKNIHRRIEIHKYESAKSADEIEPMLRKIVAESSEGLVLKNPRSTYRLNSRNDDWIKVKPEYMTEFGESLDCLIIGGYYGSGKKGGRLSSFLCGLRVDQNEVQSQGANPMKFYSFFKVGGGFRAEDYANIMHHTRDKWIDWDRKHPPKEYIELGGPDGRAEQPDVWIKPSDSLVLEVKAASVGGTDQFKTGLTLRFPRFKKIRMDKDWQTALSIYEFHQVKNTAEEEAKNKPMKVDSSRRNISKRLKKALVIAGNDSKVRNPYAGPKTAIFEGLTFCVLSEMLHPEKKNKAEIEQIIKSNGGAIVQSPTAKDDVICLGDKKVIKVASLIKSGTTNIMKPSWILDALKQAEIDGPGRDRFIVPFEPKHMLHIIPDAQELIQANVDVYGDSYTRDVSVDELRILFDDMIHPKNSTFSPGDFLSELENRGKGLGELRGSMFRGCTAYFPPSEMGDEKLDHKISKTRFQFAGGKVMEGLDEEVTHIIVTDEDPASVKNLRGEIARLGRIRLPRLVKWGWVVDSWAEGTRLDEEGFAV